MAMHELALSVIHDGSHYAERCEKQRTSTPAMYKAYIRELVYREERHQRSVYGASFTYVDLRIATDEVVEYMNDHMGGMAELPGNEHLHGVIMVDRRILREFMQGYFACALWSSNDESTEDGGSPLDESYSVDDIDAKCEAGATNECKDFIEANWADLQEYVERRRIECLANGWNVWGSAAHDFWLSRNGHGAGFFDRGLGALGDRLQAAAKVYGEQYLYVGDNDTLYIGGFENYEAPAGEAAA